MHCNWRTAQQWWAMNVPISTPSNEACKMFDATVTQYMAWRDYHPVGGIQGSLDKMMAADPDFVMGHVLKTGLELLGTARSVHTHPALHSDVQHMLRLARAHPRLHPSERKHVSAISMLAQGRLGSATSLWEEILVDHPLDPLALKFAHYGHFYRGHSVQMRDNVARVLPLYAPHNPYYGYILSLHAFGLEETNLYDRAEKVARKSLEVNVNDPWGVHTLCHVMEMTGRQEEGLTLLDDTVRHWESSRMLACHNYWHGALFHVEKGDYEPALDILDSQVMSRACQSDSLHDIVDVCSLLFRLQMEGVELGGRWREVHEAVTPHLDDRILAFNDMHILMACLGAGRQDSVRHLMDSIEGFVRDGDSGVDTVRVMREVGRPLCRAFVAYSAGDFGLAVDTLCPVRYSLVHLGWSHAQRDVFNLFLIQAAIKSPKEEHHRLARRLLMERKLLKEQAPMTDRLTARALALHMEGGEEVDMQHVHY